MIVANGCSYIYILINALTAIRSSRIDRRESHSAVALLEGQMMSLATVSS